MLQPIYVAIIRQSYKNAQKDASALQTAIIVKEITGDYSGAQL
jgi:hypothetical protein